MKSHKEKLLMIEELHVIQRVQIGASIKFGVACGMVAATILCGVMDLLFHTQTPLYTYVLLLALIAYWFAIIEREANRTIQTFFYRLRECCNEDSNQMEDDVPPKSDK